MKTKALIFLVLLALPLVMVPIAVHADDDPDPVKPRMWVSPSPLKFWAPCQISNEFTVEIKLWNKKEITDVSIYAYDFKVTWDKSLIAYVSHEVIIPADWNRPEGYYIIVDKFNETGLGNDYHLAVTALNSSPGLEDVQIVLVRITFHIEKEPCWGASDYSCKIDLTPIKISDPCGSSVTVDHTDGLVYVYKNQPVLWLDPQEWSSKCICKDTVISVMATNLTAVKGFELKVTWNNTDVLQANIQCVHVTDLLPEPYTYYKVTVNNTAPEGEVYVKVEMPCDKPPISCVEGPLVTICFHSNWTKLGKELPKDEDVVLNIENARINECGKWVTPNIISVEDAIYEALYEWRPKVEDLNLDCHVDIIDLAAIAGQYGKTPAHVWTGLAQPTDQPVDIFDIVMVAKKYCKTN